MKFPAALVGIFSFATTSEGIMPRATVFAFSEGRRVYAQKSAFRPAKCALRPIKLFNASSTGYFWPIKEKS